MWWLILEAAGAFFIFAFIVWWTMFSGRKPDPDEILQNQPENPQANTRNDDSGKPTSL
ncbi:MAG: hypothetical protein JWP38_1511 [Herbaspirillum sp.]|jgi:hypothetical protein|nr:hypothetical protein [Herbaspirillum sp.]